jgi:hypothetical protein
MTTEIRELLIEASQATLRHLQSSDGMDRIRLAEGQFHSGDDPIRADLDAHEVFEDVVRDYENRVGERSVYAVTGEERPVAIPERLEPGVRIIIVDPLDGSAQWSIFRSAFCVAAYSVVADADGALNLEAAVIADPGRYYYWSESEGVHMGISFEKTDRTIRIASIVPENGFDTPTIAFTGFKPKDRRALVQIGEEFKDWNIINIGGNPVTPYVLTGSLTAAVTLRPQASWDAIGILMATETDAVVGDLEGTLVHRRQFRRTFDRIVVAGNVRRVPAMIVAKSDVRFNEVSEKLLRLSGEGVLLSPPVPDPGA